MKSLCSGLVVGGGAICKTKLYVFSPSSSLALRIQRSFFCCCQHLCSCELNLHSISKESCFTHAIWNCNFSCVFKFVAIISVFNKWENTVWTHQISIVLHLQFDVIVVFWTFGIFHCGSNKIIILFNGQNFPFYDQIFGSLLEKSPENVIKKKQLKKINFQE